MDSKFVLNGFPYLGKDESRSQNQSLGESVVMRLVEHFANTGRNITTDNFFTSVKLANNLLAKRTTIIGTINRTRREIPPYVKSLHMTLFETKILKSDRSTPRKLGKGGNVMYKSAKINLIKSATFVKSHFVAFVM